MKSRIREKSKKVTGVKDFVKTYPGATILAAIIVAGGIGLGIKAMPDKTDDNKVLENENAVVEQIKDKKDTKEDNKTEENKEKENSEKDSEKDKTEDKKDESSEEKSDDEKKDEQKSEETPSQTPSAETQTPAVNNNQTSQQNNSQTQTPTANNNTQTQNNSATANTQTNNNTQSQTQTQTQTQTPAANNNQTTQNNTTTQTQNNSSTTSNSNSTTASITASSQSLAAKAKEHKNSVNSDTVGWVYVPNTNISYPVVQKNNNDYYAARDYQKQYSKNGVIYADYECSIGANAVNSKNTILYGHNWTNCWNPIRRNNPNDVMFAQLAAYHYLDFAQSSPFIYFSTTGKDYVWQVFAAFYTEATWTSYIYANPNDYADVLNQAKKRSLHNFNVNVSTSDQILTLSTCTRMYGNHSNQRFVVMAKKVPAGTAATNIVANPNFKKPNC